MTTYFAQTFRAGMTKFSGGQWATIVTPEPLRGRIGTAYRIRPDGSLCEPRWLTSKERKTLQDFQKADFLLK
jgi:hypothetical protein